MPQTTRYNFSTTTYTTTISCRDCGVEHAVEHSTRYDFEPTAEIDATFRFHTGNGRYLSRCRSCERAHVRRWRENRRVPAAAVPGQALEGDRRFGVEMETYFTDGTTRSMVQNRLSSAGLRGWRVKSDCSISGGTGAEIVSPILRGEDGKRQVRMACEILNEMGAKVNRSTGLHVHHEVSDLTLDDFKRVVRSWTDNQRAIDRLVSPSRRRGSCRYAAAWSSRDVSYISDCTTLDSLRNRGCFNVTRYKTLNVSCFPRYGTIEIRQHQGTTDADKVVTWVEFGQAIIDQSKTEVVSRSTTATGLMDKLATLAETSKTFLRQREEHFAAAI